MQHQRGFTLLELLVVLAIISFSVAGVSLSLRDSSQSQLEREAQRLIAVLEASRAQSRTSGVPILWQATAEGFIVQSPLSEARAETWLTTGALTMQATTTAPENKVVLGPEPILAPTRITLSVTPDRSASPGQSVSIGTDGLRPFQVLP